MRILYETTIADLVAYERYRYDHSPSTRPRGFFTEWGWLVAASLHVGAVYALGWARDPTELLFGLLILSCCYYTFFQRVRRMWSQKSKWKISREAKTRGLLGPRELELEGDNLIEVSDYHIRATPLDEIEKIVTTDEYAFFYTGAETAFVIPRRYLTRNDFQSFVALVSRACWAKERVAS